MRLVAAPAVVMIEFIGLGLHHSLFLVRPGKGASFLAPRRLALLSIIGTGNTGVGIVFKLGFIIRVGLDLLHITPYRY